MTGSRERVLGRVRAALADVGPSERAEDVEVPRDYLRSHDQGEMVPLLVDRLLDYKALVHQVRADEISAAIAAAMARRDTHRVVVPADFPEEWTSHTATTILSDDGLATAALDGVDGAITTCAVAVAETGTIVLDTGVEQGRRAITLVPDYHLCVVEADRIVASVPDAVARLDPRRPLTWISGPSATSDIELNRIEGVHGPRTLEVLIVVE